MAVVLSAGRAIVPDMVRPLSRAELDRVGMKRSGPAGDLPSLIQQLVQTAMRTVAAENGDLHKRLPHYAYFPFGGGPRVCIGSNFAMLEAVLVLATVVARYHFTLLPDPPVVPRPVVTLRPAHGIFGTLHKRGTA